MSDQSKFIPQARSLNILNTSLSSERSARLAQKTVQRATIREDKRRRADAFKDEGNKYFRDGRYADAVKSYERAVTTYGPRLVYLNNLAAAYIKVKRYEDAEYAAEHALMRDPKLDKARYRRALARKGQGRFKGAATDLTLVIQRDPTCQEAVRELEEIRATVGLDEDTYDGEDADRDVESLGDPFPDDEVLDFGDDTPMLSETSDFEHEGNGTPCRPYNHDGCKIGADCRFKHAPDSRSIRDNLGRNVCLLYVYGGQCKTPEAECPYAHDRTYLPKGPWNEPRLHQSICNVLEAPTPERISKVLDDMVPITKTTQPARSGSFLPHVKAGEILLAGIAMFSENRRDDPSQSEPARPRRPKGKGKAKTRVRGKGKTRAAKPRRAAYEEESEVDSEVEREMEERMENYGFTKAEVFKLMCQGVKPWDDNACDVLEALQA